MDVKLDKWHKCKVDIEVLKELSKKSDIKGLQHVSVFFGLLLVTGTLAYITWGTWWSAFWFLVYGNIYGFSNPLWHETGHKTAFKSKSLNEFFYYISSYLSNFEPLRWRYTHFVHHGNTYSTENPFDHEIEYGNNLKETPKNLIMNLIPFMELLYFKKSIAYEIIQHAFGVKTKVMQDCIPENAQSKVIFNSRVFVAIWIASILWSLIIIILVASFVFFITKILWKNFTQTGFFYSTCGFSKKY
jgi:fatty acid desaturase